MKHPWSFAMGGVVTLLALLISCDQSMIRTILLTLFIYSVGYWHGAILAIIHMRKQYELKD